MTSQTIFRSPLPDVEIPALPLTELVFRHTETSPDKAALIDGTNGRTLTYGQLRDQAYRLAGGLAARGFGPGNVLAIMAPNMLEYAVIFHAVALAGGTITTINPTYTAGEVHHQLVDANAELLITIAPFLETATTAAADTNVTSLVVVGPDAPDGTIPFASLFGEPIAGQVDVGPDHVVVLPYSSGTTGLSKGVMLTHHNLVANISQILSASGMGPDDSLDAVLPFFHIYGMQIMMNAGLTAGGTLVTLPRFDLVQYLEMHQKYRLTRSYLAPPIIVALAKHPIIDNYDLAALRIVMSGAAPLSAELALEAGTRLGVDVIQGYGMTELSPVSHMTLIGQAKPGSVGITVPNTESMIVDPTTGQSLPIDQDGELWVRGPQVMAGYLNNESATAATIDADGWLHTGDIGHVDADGHVYIVDRLKELIKYKGFQVAPAELEAMLLTHPAVADAAVIGRPDEEAGEVPIGFVVLKQGAEVVDVDIMSFVAGQVATYKQLRAITFLDAIPKSPSGKILRRQLRQQ